MTDKFQNKYRISSARLQNWDYIRSGMYFITVCTYKHIHYFGEIENRKMNLSHIGILADIFWYEIKNHTKNVELGEFVVMPNHIHGILILNKNGKTLNVKTLNVVETLHATSLQPPQKNDFMASISPKSNSVSSIIRSYKSAVTKHARRLGFDFAWQTRFHDHIIRNEKSFRKISEYIIYNQKKWQNDKFYS